MIRNDAELELVRQNLANIEAAIEWWRQRLLPHNEQNFNLYAGALLDFRDEFQADIDAYLGTMTVPAKHAAGKTAPTDTKTLQPTRDDRTGSGQVT
ncbi:MAG: hypothetical protein J2P46_06890 [Zavarzinella sp.]|nr:hypothetical protein [Zavarzinella sp.]